LVRFLVDEDVDIAVGGMLANRGNDVRFVKQVLGGGSKDPVIRRYLRVMLRDEDVVLVTADNEFAGRCSQEGSRLPCVWLRDLVTEEYSRALELVEVIEGEAAIGGKRFFMEIRAKSYVVKR
jgi:predicted nuclease of predicted toxin-antitoxin system